ncbi:MAG TPA: hypothetical protein VIJ51_06415 [Solirubrobacteraceae bacterium]
MRIMLLVAALAVGAGAATVGSASGSSTGTCLSYSGETLLDIPGHWRIFAVSVPPGPTARTVVSVYACRPGRTARTRVVVERDDRNGGYTCGPALIDSSRSWLAVGCTYVGGTFVTERAYEFRLGSAVGRRTATIVGGGLVGVLTSGGVAVIDGCDSTLEVADATGVHVVAPAKTTDIAVGGAHLYWWTGTAIAASTGKGHPIGLVTTPGRCD